MELRRDIFQAIADPTRRDILHLLSKKSMTVGDIASKFESSRPTISKHLQILAECEAVEKEQSGRKIYYRLKPQKLEEVTAFLRPFQSGKKETQEKRFEDAIRKFRSPE